MNSERSDHEVIFQAKLGDLGINTSDPEHANPDRPEDWHWETSLFYHKTLMSALVTLSSLQADTRNAQMIILSTLHNISFNKGTNTESQGV